MEQLFTELRESTVGTRIKFHLQEAATTIEGIIISPPGERPPGLEEGVFLQDLEDHTQIYCLCEDNSNNGVGNILVHTFAQGVIGVDRGPSPMFNDEISRDLKESAGVHAGGGVRQELDSSVTGEVDTDAAMPPPLKRETV